MYTQHSIHLEVADKVDVKVERLTTDRGCSFSLTRINFGQANINIFGLRPEELSKLGYELTKQAAKANGTDR